MKTFFSLLSLLVFTLVVCAQSEMPFTFEGDGETPEIEHTRATRDNPDYPFNEQYTDPGAVIYHDGQFHMLRNAFVGWPSAVWIHYLISDDGIIWRQPSDEPVLHSDDVPYADVAILASSLVVEDDGTWVLYFYTWNVSSFSYSNGEIGRATASNPQGPWTVDEEPVLRSSGSNSFDERGLLAPQVLRTDTGYVMYYDGSNSRFDRSIGMATSEDGIIWEKFADNPILSPEFSWEGDMNHQARVIASEDGYLMIYRTESVGANSPTMRLGVATSADGITWERAEDPILSPSNLPNHQAFYFTAVAQVEDKVYLFIELAPFSDVTDIYTMTAPINALLLD